MGNQSTSGIAEERAENERGKSEEISSPKELKEENKIKIQENELNLQEKAEKEEHRGSDDEECETQIVVELNASNLEEGRSTISNEEQDQLCSIEELQEDQNVLVEEIDAHVVERKEDLVEADTASVEGAVLETRVDKDCTPQEDDDMLVMETDDHAVEKTAGDLVEADTASVESAVLGMRMDKDRTPQEEDVGITSDIQEDQVMLGKEIDDHVMEQGKDEQVEAGTASVEGALLGMRVDMDRTPQEEAVWISSDLQEDQNMLKEIDDLVVEQSEDELVEADTACVEGSLLDARSDKACTPQEAVETVSDLQEYQHMLVKGIDDQVVEKHEYSDTEAPLLETRIDKDCKQQEAVVVTSVLRDRQNMLKEIDDNGLNEADPAPIEGTLLETSRVDKDSTPQEGVDTASHPQDHDHDILVKEIDDEKREDSSVEANTPSVEGRSRNELVKNDDHPQKKQSNSFTSLNELQNISLLDSSAEENGKDELMMNELGIDECDHPSNADQSQPSDQESDQEIKHLLNEAPQQMIKDHPNEGAHGSTETRDFGSNTSSVDVQVELRKAPSFDFGLLFDARSEESDQTPLLFQDKAPMRSYSTCSNPRFQDRSAQTEYSGKYGEVEVEEKTIRMERSISESSMAPPVNLLNKESYAGVDTKGEHENGNGVSPRGSGKRKPRSSLFTTCICCTAAIS